MSAHRKHAQAKKQVAASMAQLMGCSKSRATPPAKISTTISTRNAAARNASAAITRSYSRFTASRLFLSYFLVNRVFRVLDLQHLVRFLSRLAEGGEVRVLDDGHAAALQLLLDLGFELEDLPRGGLARLVAFLDQDLLILLRQ